MTFGPVTPEIGKVTTAPCGIIQSTPSQSSSETVLTPRKGIEAALLSHLQYVTPTDAGAKRVRIKRTLAESLTSEESRQRLKEAERIKSVKSKGKFILQKKQRLANLPTNDEVTGAGNRLSVGESTHKGQHIAESSEVNTNATTLKPVRVDSSSQNFVELQKGEQTRTKKKIKKLRRPVFRKEDQPKVAIRKPSWMNNESHEKEQPAVNSGLTQPVMTNNISTVDGKIVSTGDQLPTMLAITDDTVVASSNRVADEVEPRPSNVPDQQLSANKFYGTCKVRKPSRYAL